MKKESVDGEHCPYCKKHCSLSDPHCKKGKTLAEEKKKERKEEAKKEEVKKEEVKKEEAKEEERKEEAKKEEAKTEERRTEPAVAVVPQAAMKNETSESGVAVSDFEKKKESDAAESGSAKAEPEIELLPLFQECYRLLPCKKNGKQGNKKRKLSILTIVAEKGELTQKELKEYAYLSEAELILLLSKMKKKGYINWKQENSESSKISLTESGLKVAKEHRQEGKQDSTAAFSVLEEEEKRRLEYLLKKLYAEWSHTR